MSEAQKTKTSIKDLYNQDVKDRNNNYEVDKLNKRDKQRINKVKKMIENKVLTSGLDYHHASLILQHGERAEYYKLAHELVEKALDLGDETAKWLYAATLDRWLLSVGKPQNYGTQFKKDSNGEWQIVLPINPLITDQERAKYNIPLLSEALKVYKTKYNLK